MYTALLVDDEIMALVATQASFDWDTYHFSQIHETSEASKALDILKNKRIDAAFVDIRMPEMSGLDLIEICKNSGIQTKFIIVSGYSDFSYAKTAIRLDVIDYCLKPVDMEETSPLMRKISGEIRKIRLLNDSHVYNSVKNAQNTEAMLSYMGLDISGKYYRGIYWNGDIEDCWAKLNKSSLDLSIITFFLEEKSAFFILSSNQEITVDFSGLENYSAAVSASTQDLHKIPPITQQAETVMRSGKPGRTDFELTLRPNEYFNQLLQYINNNYTRDLNLKQIAEQFALNYTYCSDLFKKMTGFPFTVYVTRLRVNKACLLLKDTDTSIEHICLSTGFSDYHYFAGVFKKQTGLTPSQYRENMRKGIHHENDKSL